MIIHGKIWTREALRTVDLYPGGSAKGEICLAAGDCSPGTTCDLLDYVCGRTCHRTFWSITGCGPDAWCMPVDALAGGAEGVCRQELAGCDMLRQRGCERFGPAYALTCQPLDSNTAGCRAAGSAAVGQACSYTDLGSSCAPGLYCSPLSGRCFALCDPTDGAQACTEPTRCQWQLDGAGEHWFGLCL